MNSLFSLYISSDRFKHSLILSTIQRLARNPGLLIAVVTLMFYLLLFALRYNFKLATIVTLLTVTLYYLITKNLFFSLFSAFLVSAPFLIPAKQYEFEYASASEYTSHLLPQGIIRSINLTTSNVLGVLIMWFLLLMVIKRIVHTERPAPNPFVVMLNLPLFKFVSFCWLGYFIISLYSSLYYSLLPNYSLYLLFEDSKLFIGFIGIIYLAVTKTGAFKFKYVYIVLLTMLLFQNAVGFSQFITSLGYNYALYSGDIEENIPLARIEGISYHANLHAFIILLLFALVLPYIAKRKRWLFNIAVLSSAANIVLSQSRTAWLGVAAASVYAFIALKNDTIKSVFALLKGAKLYRVIFLSILALIIMLPRLQTSSIFFSEEGGGRLRARMISEGWRLLQESPFIGFGQGSVVKVFLTNYSDSYAETFPSPVHFAFLQLALESGIPGAILFYLPFLVFLIKYTRHLKHPSRRFRGALLSSVCGIIILLVNHSLQPAGELEFYLMGVTLGFGILSLSHINPEIYI